MGTPVNLGVMTGRGLAVIFKLNFTSESGRILTGNPVFVIVFSVFI
jgi:hypothetical protein